MMSKKIFILFLGAMFCLSASTRMPIAAQGPLDGRNRIFHDELLGHLVGDWKLTRKIRGQTVENTVKAEWVLQHQFLRVHMKGLATPPDYEAMIFIGYDNASERYVAHWIDVFGGRISETLAMALAQEIASSLSSSIPTARFTIPSPGMRRRRPGLVCWSKRTRLANGKNSLWISFIADHPDSSPPPCARSCASWMAVCRS